MTTNSNYNKGKTYNEIQQAKKKSQKRTPGHSLVKPSFWHRLWFCITCRKTVTQKKEVLYGSDFDKSFKMFDTDHSGTITYKELKKTFKAIKVSMTDSEAKSIISRFDTDGDGFIDKGEFGKFVQCYLRGLSDEQTKNPVWLFLDKDGDGSVTAVEFAEAVQTLTGKTMTVEEAREFLIPFYPEGSEELTTDTFAQAMVAFILPSDSLECEKSNFLKSKKMRKMMLDSNSPEYSKKGSRN